MNDSKRGADTGVTFIHRAYQPVGAQHSSPTRGIELFRDRPTTSTTSSTEQQDGQDCYHSKKGVMIFCLMLLVVLAGIGNAGSGGVGNIPPSCSQRR